MNRTQKEVIKIFEEKQQSAERSLNAIKDIKSKANERKQLLGEVEAYEDCIAFLRGCTIVEKQPKQDLSKIYGKLPISREVARKQFNEFDQPIVEEKIIYAGKVMDYGKNIRILDGVSVYQFPKYAVDRSQEVKPREDVGAKEPKNICDTCDANRDKYGLCMWIKGTGIKASQCGHYSKPKDNGKAEALGVNEPTCDSVPKCVFINDIECHTQHSCSDCKLFADLFTRKEAKEPKADITKDKFEGVWVLYSGVITEKDGNVYIDDGTQVYCFPKYSTTRDKDLKYYYQEQKPNQIVGVKELRPNISREDIKDQRFYTKYEEPKIVALGDQFREFVDSLDNQTYFVNAKNVAGLSIEKAHNRYYINIYIGQIVVLEFETEQEQLDKYNELKDWVKRWNQ